MQERRVGCYEVTPSGKSGKALPSARNRQSSVGRTLRSQMSSVRWGGPARDYGRPRPESRACGHPCWSSPPSRCSSPEDGPAGPDARSAQGTNCSWETFHSAGVWTKDICSR